MARFTDSKVLIGELVLALLLPCIRAENPPTDAGSSSAVAPSGGTNQGFTLLSPKSTGILFSNVLSPERAAENQIRMNGSGVAAGDVDGDGKCDLYFCGLENDNRLYRNLGNWRFEDITESAGVGCANQYSTAAVLADIDGDGDLDLLVNSIGGGTRLFLNDGQAHFKEKPDCGLVRAFGGTSMTLADIDGDGDLDLYVANYGTTTIRSTGFPLLNANGRRSIPAEYRERLQMTSNGRVLESGEPDFLYLNDGGGNFTAVTWQSGRFKNEAGAKLTTEPKDWGLCATFRSLSGQSRPDLYVCNDFHTPDRIWLNDGKGNFTAASEEAIRNSPTFSMSVDMADIDRDGNPDLIAADMLEVSRRTRLRQTPPGDPIPGDVGGRRPQIDRNTVQLNRGDGTFAEIAHYCGLAAANWSWSLVFVDVDLDGYEDLLVTTGNMFNTQDLDANEAIDRNGPYPRERIPSKLLMYPRLTQRKLAFRNLGNLRFEEAGDRWQFNQAGVSHGICLADLDNDGDLDVVVSNLNGAAGLYRNESTAPRVAVRLKGAGANTRGIGAKVKLLGGAVPMQSQEMISGGRYLSSDDAMRVFAASSNDMRLEVTWPGGKETVVQGVRANRIYEVAEANAAEQPARKTPTAAKAAPLFEEASNLIAHSHHETAFDDFARQGLLPNRLSQLGPGVAWFDANGDGWEDLAIGSGRGGSLALYENDGKGGLKRNSAPPYNQTVTRDQTTILSLSRSNAAPLILAGSSNYEDGMAAGSSVRVYDPANPKIQDPLAGQLSSTGPLALGDVDGDGSLELFIGGRVVPARYPEPATSQIWKQQNGAWVLDEANSAVLKDAGLVSGAVWTDLNQDGYPELVLACEWAPVRIFANEKGRLRDATQSFGMDKRIGWWNGVTAGDFDGDGRMDLIASNWGLNSKYQIEDQHGPRLYYGLWGGSGEIEMLEAVFDSETKKWLPERDLNSVGRSIPSIREKFRTHRAYAEAGIEAILGERLKEARVLEANWLETTVFLNRGGHFELGTLPVSAQFTPAFGINVADFDGDGREDVFLSQNFFAVQPQTSRNDAGRGLLLRGRGDGTFDAIDGSVSGIKVYGEQRGSAVADYDGDGRVDLVVTQNGAETKLYRNRQAKPGLRVRLAGPANNVRGIGAVLRVESGNRLGPAREVHSGSGYWAQDSAVQVLAVPEGATGLEVVWPGGKITKVDLPAGAQEVEVSHATGKARVLR